jgi:hypothetical protein
VGRTVDQPGDGVNGRLVRDGQRFVMFKGGPIKNEPQPATTIHVVLNWFEELNELVRVD